MMITTPCVRNVARQELNRDIEKFLASGGKVKTFPTTGMSKNREVTDWKQQSIARFQENQKPKTND